MIQSWNGKEAEAIFNGRQIKNVPADLAKMAKRRLERLASAVVIDDLRAPPGNHLHMIGDRWSIRVNMQHRITFILGDKGPEEVWFGDYH